MNGPAIASTSTVGIGNGVLLIPVADGWDTQVSGNKVISQDPVTGAQLYVAVEADTSDAPVAPWDLLISDPRGMGDVAGLAGQEMVTVEYAWNPTPGPGAPGGYMVAYLSSSYSLGNQFIPMTPEYQRADDPFVAPAPLSMLAVYKTPAPASTVELGEEEALSALPSLGGL